MEGGARGPQSGNAPAAAIVSNPELRSFSADIKAAEGDLLQARLYPNPRAGFAGEHLGPKDDHELAWFLRQMFLTGGKFRAGINVAARDHEIAEAKFRMQ